MIDGLLEPILHAIAATARFVGEALLNLSDLLLQITCEQKNRWWKRTCVLMFSLIGLALVVGIYFGIRNEP